MRIAILGATSQIAKDLIISFSSEKDIYFFLFARRPGDVINWLDSVDMADRFLVAEYSEFGQHKYEAIVNFVGVGNPAKTMSMGDEIFNVTLRFDDLALDYLKENPTCRYLFLSSGAAYGPVFNEPVSCETPATIAINNLQPNEWYGVAKLYAECRHRALAELPIIDIRVFNYFSRSQDLSARFLMSDILRAICDKRILQTSPEYIVRDFLHPSDFHRLVSALLAAPKTNAVVDCYSRAPVDRPTLLTAMQENFGLQYETVAASAAMNATGSKPYYYSLNRHAADFGYQPVFTSLEGVLEESAAILQLRTMGSGDQ